LHFKGLLPKFIKKADSSKAIEAEEIKVDIAVFYEFGMTLIVVGLLFIIGAIILASNSGSKKSKVRGAGVIIIGPIPIIFGTDKKSIKAVLALALALTIVVLIITVVYYWLLR